MVLLLIALVLVLIITIAHLYVDFNNQKKAFEKRIDVLENVISKYNEKKAIQQSKLKLSDAMSKQLFRSNRVLSDTIFDANVELISILFNKK